MIIASNMLQAQINKNDSLDNIIKTIKTEYVKFDYLSFNNKMFYQGVKLKSIPKNKYSIKKIKDCEEGDCITFDRYYFSTNTYADYATISGSNTEDRILQISHIGDSVLKFDYYPELYVGNEINKIEKYFPVHYKYDVIPAKNMIKKSKQMLYTLIIGCEIAKNTYPKNMGYLNLGILCDFSTNKIIAFDFFDVDQ
jgi:hypothetical protein